MDTQAKFIPALSGLRFLAALSILIGHFTSGLSPFRPMPAVLMYYMQNTVIIGMPLFFILSGFIMQHVYGGSLRRGLNVSAVRTFAWARFSRLYPLYAFIIAIALFFDPLAPSPRQAFEGGPQTWALLSALTMTQTWGFWFVGGNPPHSLYWPVTWSISTEVFFYVVFPFVSLLVWRIERAKTAIVLLLGGFLCAYLAHYFAYYSAHWYLYTHPSSAPGGAAAAVRWFAYYSPYGRLPEFITGCLVARLYQIVSVSAPDVRETRIGVSIGVAAAALIVAITFAFGTIAFTHSEGRFLNFFAYLHQNFLLAPEIAALIFCAARYTAIGRPLSGSRIVYLGEISYSLYLMHPLAERMLTLRSTYETVETKAVAYFLVAFVAGTTLTLALSVGTYTMIEVPARNRLRRLYAWMYSPRRSSDTEVGHARGVSLQPGRQPGIGPAGSPSPKPERVPEQVR